MPGMKFFYKVTIALTIAALVAVLIMLSKGLEHTGPYVLTFFVLLAISLCSSPKTKSFAYTVLIFGAAAMALYYPEFFISYGNFKYATLIIPLIQLIMFGMGTSMHYQDFLGVLKSPGGIIIGVVSHFIIMPLLGFSIATLSVKLTGMPAEIAAGIILIGCCPNGMASNVVSYLARANLALSVTITSISTMLSPVLTPFLMNLLAGPLIKIDPWLMVVDIFKMVMIPIALGVLFSSIAKEHSRWLKRIMPFISMGGIIGIIIIITAAGRDSLLKVGVLLAALVLLHNIGGYLLGFWSAKALGMEERDCRTIAIEVGMQNGGMAAGLAKGMGKIATLGLAPVIFSTFMNITGSLLASYWHKRKPGPAHEATLQNPAEA
ncbi:bile acid:sodium symporter family protein [Mucilaginibacter rubeus]|uniref:Bile acid:sodium symporter family protein n=2 Tax=Mucilaginibacter rubeus TaxID=2027860 RepID=A0ABX7U5K3_9SPHI|nr:bile acid:sodium symporter family protein [Mucilaginibacter rubeus]QTE47714.1 bile acid:sodium symporter family protein [Mucilaginibacter rubeus]QTE59105.1 bile acid:sodium symporter family protein [Mucilaginibacter rubeus]QTE61434.1 bile acid:sodium symporter family protein [Mucilaginibacter rubeus]QTF60193.1 bile acid:sodium symporter family protein [Mucilaginibacter rubeus]